jgi:hypothetical protein
MTITTYQVPVTPLLHAVASPDLVEDEEAVMDSSETFGQELREAVAKVLKVDPETLRPTRQG